MYNKQTKCNEVLHDLHKKQKLNKVNYKQSLFYSNTN